MSLEFYLFDVKHISRSDLDYSVKDINSLYDRVKELGGFIKVESMKNWAVLVPDSCEGKEAEAQKLSNFYEANIWEYEELVYKF